MHPIHKHGSGMRSAERYDAKEAYNKKLSSKARMHYLENDIADHKGSPAKQKGNRGDHSAMTDGEYSRHLETPRGKKEHGAGMSRYSVEKGPHAPHGNAPHRKSSPANNVNYGTGYIGEKRYDDMKYNAVDDKAGVSRYKKDHKAVSRKASPLNNEGHDGKEGHMHRSIKKKKGKLKPIVNKETKERLPKKQK